MAFRYKFLPFCVFLGFSLGFFLSSGHVFVRTDLNDYSFHLARAFDPLGSFPEFYLPLWSVLWHFFGVVLGYQAAYIFLSSFLLFFLIPFACYRLSWTFWGREDFARISFFACLLGSGALYVLWVDSLIPQALALLFLLLGLGAMEKDLLRGLSGVNYSVVLWGVLGGITHQKFIYIYFFAVLVWLWCSCRPGWYWKIWGVSGVVAALIFGVSVPFYLPDNFLEIVLIWAGFFYLFIVWSWEGPQVNGGNHSIVIDSVAVLCILSLFTDPMGRSVLFVPVLLSYLGAAFLEKKNQVWGLFIALTVFCYVIFLIFGVSRYINAL